MRRLWVVLAVVFAALGGAGLTSGSVHASAADCDLWVSGDKAMYGWCSRADTGNATVLYRIEGYCIRTSTWTRVYFNGSIQSSGGSTGSYYYCPTGQIRGAHWVDIYPF